MAYVIRFVYHINAPKKQKVSSHQSWTNLHVYIISSRSNVTMLLLLGCVQHSNYKLISIVCKLRIKMVAVGPRPMLLLWVIFTAWPVSVYCNVAPWCFYVLCTFYPHMLIGMLGIYRLLFFCLLFFVSRILVTDISGVGWHRVMKFCRMVDLGVHQVISPFGELWPMGQPSQGQKVKNLVMHIS